MQNRIETKAQLSIQSHLVDALYAGLATGLVTLFLVSSILFWVLYHAIKETDLVVWYCAVLSVILLRGLSIIWYNRTKIPENYQKYHYYVFVVGSSLTAMLLGILGSVLMPSDIAHQSFILILISGIIAGAVQSLAASFIGIISYIYLALVPILVWEFLQILQGRDFYIGIFVSMSMFCVFSFIIARREHLMLLRHLDLEYNYKELSEKMSLMSDQYKEQATHDTLTGLYNRQFLNEYLEIEIQKCLRKEFDVAIIMLDIDNFKRFNDVYGHECGDEILQLFSDTLRKNVRKSDVVCRYGGEEFIVVLPETSLKDAENLAEFLRKMVKTISFQNGPTLIQDISASFGVATFQKHGLTKREIIEAADKAMYKAKNAGRDRVVIAE